MITYERLREVLDYNAETGIFVWKVGRGNQAQAGKKAGCKKPGAHGYIHISIDDERYLAHRLAWLYVHGYFPENDIDHINKIKDANWISNLREVSMQCNIRNAKTRDDNTSGITGVSWDNTRNKWQTGITINEKRYGLGRFDDFDEAVCYRLSAEQCLNWGDCNSQSSAKKYVSENIQKIYLG